MGLAEGTAIVFGMYLSELQLDPPGLFLRLLVVPFFVVVLRVLWGSYLLCSYCRIKSTGMSRAIRMIGCVHSRSCWTCSAATFTCFSCILMVWHSIMFLLITGYDYKPSEALAARFLLGTSAVFVVTHWAFWRDFARNYTDVSEEEPEAIHLQSLLRMYKSRLIHVCKYKDLQGSDAFTAQPTCVVCLEEFLPEDDVSQLPCNHIFHPICAHKWIREDWRCPFRCQLVPAMSPKAVGVGASSPSQLGDIETGATLHW
eukprot:CAMPEP_0197894122 /NCGR_PEP_ID=MMETSP1439-20131203/34470_1 /TAXON_ID=66791 /ORGANISM="Gonyaulax spinifera, Strain CCMP409" /LENGTH=256 /DNA_ID=CAMNT_0043514439 /DNA_START=130 /DNA_END=900 /DNA_ORIENTATION=-